MPPSVTPQQFVNRWRAAEQKERSTAQSHFLELCALVSHPTPIEADPTGESFAFEYGATKSSGGNGFADVWKKGFFALEYKGKDGNMDKAYQQLLQYREALQNPPLLIVSDINQIIVHTNYTNTVKRIVPITLDDLLKPEGMAALKAIFSNPDFFRSEQTTEHVTQLAAVKFAQLAEHLRKQGDDPERIAHFLIRLLFCLFAEDIDLLPNHIFTQIVQQARSHPERFGARLRPLFAAMATGGGFGVDEIRHFNGGLFDDDSVLELGYAGLTILQEIAALDWGSIEPSILGTLFERSLDPSKRSQLGAHYTSRDDILLLVEPVLMALLRREWATIHATLEAEVVKRDADIEGWQARTDRTATAKSTQIQTIRTVSAGRINALVQPFLEKIRTIRVLDPACGSGNFLYMSLRQLLDLEKEVINAGAASGISSQTPEVNPAQLFGIELNDYAHELAQATVWIGWIQWLHENGYGFPSQPILKRLDNIMNMDAILSFDAEGNPVKPEWPEADVIVGNPPFLGGKLLRTGLKDKYVNSLFELYDEQVERQSDLVCYWFERARAFIEEGKVKRAGLIATNSIRGGANREVLKKIKETGDIFMAWSNRPWTIEGAAVRVSLVAFDNGDESARQLDNLPVTQINPDLTASHDLTIAKILKENGNLAFMGDTKVGPFDIEPGQAQKLLNAAGNPNGRPNSEVVRPWINGSDITKRPRGMFIIDFGVNMSESEASMYEAPFEYAAKHVKPFRVSAKSGDATGIPWWLHQRTRPEMRRSIEALSRYIVTSRVSKYRLFAWMNIRVLPDSATIAIAREDDYFFGVLHSKIHELWSLAMGTSLEDRPRYTPTTTFETFPFPWPPGQEPTDDPRVQAIAQAAQELVAKRDAWLNPPGMAEADLKKRTLTNLYNARPTWLDMTHKKLDAAVAVAYGWPTDLSDDEILARLLALNLERAAKKE